MPVELLRFVAPDVGKVGIAVPPLPPALEQEVALVDIHVNVEESPIVIDPGVAERLTVTEGQFDEMAEIGRLEYV